MLLCLEIGYRIGRRRRRLPDPGDRDVHGVFEAAIFALLGLLLGFAFAGSLDRLEARRDLIVREANAIGTAYLRIDLLAPEHQPEIRRLFHDYLQARLRVFDEIDAGRGFDPAMAEVSRLQQRIWLKAVEGTRETTALLVLPPLNDMIDVTTTRGVALRTQMPLPILALLLGVALLTSLLAGHGMARSGRRSLLHGVLYAFAVTLTIYVVLDLDNPRTGLIRVDAAEQALRQLQREI